MKFLLELTYFLHYVVEKHKDKVTLLQILSLI